MLSTPTTTLMTSHDYEFFDWSSGSLSFLSVWVCIALLCIPLGVMSRDFQEQKSPTGLFAAL
jgi:hypothetical protein